MTTIEQKIKVCTVDGKCEEVEALFDTGASRSYIHPKFGEKLGYKKLEPPREVDLAVEETKGMVIGEDTYYMEIDGCKMPGTTIGILENLSREAVVGVRDIEEFDIVLDTEEGRAYPKERPPKSELI